MTVQTHHFTIGNFNCIAINDGMLKLGPTSTFFSGSTPDELDSALNKYNLGTDGINLACTCLFIDTGEHRVLIDCGAGESPRYSEHFSGLGKLFAGLEQEGITTDRITHVLISHGHWDHLGGCADDKGNLLFPNARFAIAEGEYQDWINAVPESEEDTLHITQDRLKAIKPQLDFIDPDGKIVKGIRAINTPGHTSYHISFEITSGDETLICTIDALDHPLQVEHSTWSAEWDVDQQKSIESRQHILQLAAEKNALVHGFHFSFPGLGHITSEDDKWTWQALN